MEGSVTDSDGIASAELELIDEATETVVWSAALTEFDAFSATVTVPADASGGVSLRNEGDRCRLRRPCEHGDWLPRGDRVKHTPHN